MQSRMMTAQKRRIRRSWKLAIADETNVVKRRKAVVDVIQIITTR